MQKCSGQGAYLTRMAIVTLLQRDDPNHAIPGAMDIDVFNADGTGFLQTVPECCSRMHWDGKPEECWWFDRRLSEHDGIIAEIEVLHIDHRFGFLARSIVTCPLSEWSFLPYVFRWRWRESLHSDFCGGRYGEAGDLPLHHLDWFSLEEASRVVFGYAPRQRNGRKGIERQIHPKAYDHRAWLPPFPIFLAHQPAVLAW